MIYTRTFVVVFRAAAKENWWTVLLHRDFQHCFLATYIDDKRALVINPSCGGCGVHIVNKSIERLIRVYDELGYTMAIYTAQCSEMERPRLKLFRTCVGICKDFLGIAKPWIITPKQLYEEVKQ